MKRIGAIFFLLLAGITASAQFYSSGEDPGRLKWSTVTSDNFRIIYPAGNDSLALEYGHALERYRTVLGASIGYEPNSQYRRPMPVILHPYSAQANGSVVWAPRRMDLYTRPQSAAPEPMDWITELAVHESRHVSQMQFAKGRGFGAFNVLVGDLFTGALSAVYPGPALLEGDAVSTETALTRAGRGRSADFLEHYRVNFADGDFRNWYRWRWGSQKLFTPDHYRAGYMLVAGMRYVYDDPLFTKRYYSNIVDPIWPFPFFVLQRTVRQASGLRFKDTWTEIASAQQAIWAADEEARGPFGPARQLTRQGRLFTEYLSPEAAGDRTFAVRQSLSGPPQLVQLLPDGAVSPVRPFATNTSQLRYSENLDRLFWSEKVQDHRWTLKSDSRIYYLKPGSRTVHRLTSEGNLANPSPDPEGTSVSVTEYPVEGGSAVRILDGRYGLTERRFPAPDSLQVVETAWASAPTASDKRLVASAISAGGFAFYDVLDGFRPLTDPLPIKIKQLRSSEEGVFFVSDLGGVNELYLLSLPDDHGSVGTVARLTNNRFGASDFLPSASDDSLTFSALTTEGRMLYRGTKGSYPTETASWPIADRLSEQESALSPSVIREAESRFSSPKPYRKLTHLLRLHSWVPVYVDYDAIANSSYETVFSTTGLGATAFFQNDLGTASLIAGYSAALDIQKDDAVWDHSFHGKFTYRGWYPVIELSTTMGKGLARRYQCNTILFDDHRTMSIDGKETDVPSFRTTARIYIPWDFSNGGWYRGLVPRIEAQYSNDIVNTAEIYYRILHIIGEKSGVFRIPAGAGDGHVVPMARLTASVRGYATTGRGRSAVYPRWGVGAEGGFSMRPGATGLFAPAAYAYLYGYVPGLMDTHGIRLSAVYQTRFDGLFPDNFVNILPRGMGGVSNLQSYLLTKYESQTRFTFDYSLPLLPVDWSGLGPIAYVRNFELTLHADGTVLGQKADALLYSAGVDLSVRLGNLLWIPYATRVGVSYNYNGGSIISEIPSDYDVPKHNWGLVFTVEMP